MSFVNFYKYYSMKIKVWIDIDLVEWQYNKPKTRKLFMDTTVKLTFVKKENYEITSNNK